MDMCFIFLWREGWGNVIRGEELRDRVGAGGGKFVGGCRKGKEF